MKHFQATIWKQSSCHEPNQLNPCEYGWTRDITTKSLLPTMFPPSTKPIPDNILRLIACNCKSSECSTGVCSCAKIQMSCSEFCTCQEEGCLSKWTQNANNDDEEDEDET